MFSAIGERAIADALGRGRALLKYISPNDVGLTGSHQYGFYLPVSAWEMFTPQSPVDGINHKHFVGVTWNGGRITESAVTWYGKGTRHEYRLTRFGRNFPFLDPEAVGNLLVLVPEHLTHFQAFVLESEEDIEELQAALGVEVVDTWAIYQAGVSSIDTEDDCINRRFREFATGLEAFPTGAAFSEAARNSLLACNASYKCESSDWRLVRAVEAEYRLFRLVENHLCAPEISKTFESVDEFLKTAATIMNRRKSRAGRSLEHHIEYVLRDADVPFDVRPDIDGKPDLVIPSRQAYEDPKYPVDKLFVVGIKTTCKDRWRQVTREGRRVPQKHLLTMQRGISTNQLAEMAGANITLVVPGPLHDAYPPERPMQLHTVDAFIDQVRLTIS